MMNAPNPIDIASHCLTRAGQVSNSLGGISELMDKLYTCANADGDADLTPLEAAMCSWAVGVVVNLKLAEVSADAEATVQRQMRDEQWPDEMGEHQDDEPGRDRLL